jgi:hypothetical protein
LLFLKDFFKIINLNLSKLKIKIIKIKKYLGGIEDEKIFEQLNKHP